MESVTTGVVVVGAGAAGLLAAVVARRLGNEVILVEATDSAGGATAVGDGTVWLPANDFMGTGSLPADSVDEARQYLDLVLDGAEDPTALARRDAFVRTAGKVARWLVTSKIRLSPVRHLPDEHEVDGAKAQGRCLRVQALDRALVSDVAARVKGLAAEDQPRPIPVVGGLQRIASRIFGQRSEVPEGGPALVAELLRRAHGSGVRIEFETPMTGLVVEEGRVVGIVTQADDDTTRIDATAGVILACGGFEANAELRDEHLPLPTNAAWSAAGVPTNQGAGFLAAQSAGAARMTMTEAWWAPVMVANGEAHTVDLARSAPHSLIVDQAGDRFLDEAESPVAATRRIFERNRGMRAVPCYLVMDNRHRQSYPLGPYPAGVNPREALDSGDLVKAATLDELAQTLGVDRAGLIGSVVAFNAGPGKGRDTDFGRGSTRADKARGDANQRRSPCLGKVDKGPYWATRIYPGDTGTRGGLVVDDNGRVLDGAGQPIPGLYACAGPAASWISHGYPAPGASLGAALVDAYRAALSVSDQVERLDEGTG